MDRQWGAAFTVAVVAASCAFPCGAVDGVAEARIATITGASGWAVNRPKQRKVFIIHDTIWLFFVDGAALKYVTSETGETWSAPTTLRDARYGHRVGLWFDSVAVHYATCDAGMGSDVYYRKGVPEADGSITWTREEQLVFDVPVEKNVLYPNVVVSADGRPWVSMLLFEGGDHTLPGDGVVLRSTRDDGVWETDGAFPHRLVEDNSETFPEPLGVPLASGGLVWLYNRDGAGYFARAWQDGAWGAEELLTDTRYEHSLFAAQADGDVVHAVLATGGTIGWGVVHRQRSADGAWSKPTLISSSASGHTALTRAGEGHLIVTLLDANLPRLLTRELSADGWGPLQTLVDLGKESIPSHEKGWVFNALFSSSGRIKGVATVTVGSDDEAELRAYTTAW